MSPGARRGRPARIDREAITDAVLAVGLESATMQSVAQRIGVSTAALYHHVDGRDGLLRMACERLLAENDSVLEAGKSWAQLLWDWAFEIHEVLAAGPVLIEFTVNGVIGDDKHLPAVGRLVDALVAQGFAEHAAIAAVETVGAVATGSAIQTIRERREIDAGRSWPQRVHGLFATTPAAMSAGLLGLALANYSPAGETSFTARLSIALTGIAVVNGLSADDATPHH